MNGGGIRVVWVAAAILGLVVAAPGARAQQGGAPAPGQGAVVAFACGALAPHASIDVEALDDTHAQMALRKEIVSDLVKRGFTVDAHATARLTFESGLSREFGEQGRQSVGSLQSNNDVTEFRLNMWSSRGVSVLGGNQDLIPRVNPNLFRLSIFINDRTNGACLWQGEARHTVVHDDPAGTARKLVPVVLDRLGKTVKATAFTLPE